MQRGPTKTRAKAEKTPIKSEVEEQAERLRLYEAVINNFPGGIVLTNRNLRVVLCNEQQKKLLEFPDNLFLGRAPSLEEVFHFNAVRGEYGPGNPDEIVASRMDLVRRRIPHVYERTRPDGRVLEVRGVPLPEGGFVTSYTDVTDRRLSQEIIFRLATKDNLTGLGNRHSLKDGFEKAVASARRGRHFALHLIDLDQFKPVNDNLGHNAGDEVLKEVGRRLQENIRDTDAIARYGGDEFIVLQDDVTMPSQAVLLADRIIQVLSNPIFISSHTIVIGACIGIALSTSEIGEFDFDSMMRKADEALYACKRSTKGTFRIHNAGASGGGKGANALSRVP